MEEVRFVAHVLWDLPFLLRLPPDAFLCWEAEDGVAAFAPRPKVGSLQWHRKCEFLQPSQLFSRLAPGEDLFGGNDYRIDSGKKGGAFFTTALLKGGQGGGFTEARPFTAAEMLLCIRDQNPMEDGVGPRVLGRAVVALNNLLEVYRFLTMDSGARSMRGNSDHYYSLVSFAPIPEDLRGKSVREILLDAWQLTFGTTIGVDRVHHVGLHDFNVLWSGPPVEGAHLDLFGRLVQERHDLELFHHLLLSAVRRLQRGENALALVDAQSAMETLVAVLVAEGLQREGKSARDVEVELSVKGKYHLLQARLKRLDAMAEVECKARSLAVRKFLGGQEEREWRLNLYGLRNRIVHAGQREVTFDEAKTGVGVAISTIDFLQSLCPAFNRKFNWSKSLSDLPHVRGGGGAFSRLFEA